MAVGTRPPGPRADGDGRPDARAGDTPARQPATAPARRRRWGLIGGVAVAGLLAVEVVLVAPYLRGTLATLRSAQPAWVALGVLAAALSLLMFAGSRRRLLTAAGVPVPVRPTLAAVLVANAVHVTLPGGAAFSTAYTFRWMRGRGASAPAATWALVAGGLVASASLAVLGLAGSLLVGSRSGVVPTVIGVLALVLLGLALRRLVRRPDRAELVGRTVLRWANRIRRRPADAGAERLAELLLQLRAVRPRAVDWLLASVAAAANWVFDVACLAACAAALGVQVSLPVLLLTYTAGMAASSASLLPGGLGVVDAALTVGFVAGGIPAATALPAVLLYRLISLVGVVGVGWIVAAVQARRGGDRTAVRERAASAERPSGS
jgi:uncharacterized protein (TIRG00374 family)